MAKGDMLKQWHEHTVQAINDMIEHHDVNRELYSDGLTHHEIAAKCDCIRGRAIRYHQYAALELQKKIMRSSR